MYGPANNTFNVVQCFCITSHLFWFRGVGKYLQVIFIDIFVIQKRIVRIISGSNYHAHTAPLFKKLKILDVYKQFKLQVAIFVFDALHDKLPMDFKSYEHTYSTRSKDKNVLHPPKFRSNLGQTSIKFVGTVVWNSIPEDLKNITSRFKFKRELKNYLLEL